MEDFSLTCFLSRAANVTQASGPTRATAANTDMPSNSHGPPPEIYWLSVETERNSDCRKDAAEAAIVRARSALARPSHPDWRRLVINQICHHLSCSTADTMGNNWNHLSCVAPAQLLLPPTCCSLLPRVFSKLGSIL